VVQGATAWTLAKQRKQLCHGPAVGLCANQHPTPPSSPQLKVSMPYARACLSMPHVCVSTVWLVRAVQRPPKGAM
jgi:hypothetical protein